MRAFFSHFWRNPSGASAVEFALVIPVFCALTIGAINLCLLMYMDSRLQFSVDDAARCASLAFSPCAATTRAAADFGFTTLGPTFAATSPANCQGTVVTGNVTYSLNAVVATLSVPLTASSCFADAVSLPIAFGAAIFPQARR